MNNLNQRENPLLFWFSKLGDFFCLSVIWLLFCLPVLTAIPACIALYDAIAHCIHGDEEGPVRRFFRTLKNELLRGILLGVLWLVIGATLYYGYSILYQMGKQDSAAAAYSLVYLITMLIPLSMLTWLIPVQSRFRHGFLALHKVSAIYAICHLPVTVVLLVILAVAVVLVLFFPVLIVLMPAIAVTVQCRFIEKVFQKYIPQEETDEIQN